MRVLFVLPAPVRIPMGGAAVVYRHAEGLRARGHQVSVAAPQRGDGLDGWARRAAVLLRDRVHGVGPSPYAGAGVETVEPPTWRSIDPRRYDAVIATGHQTAPWVSALTDVSPAVGVYFLQHDERHLDPGAGETWALPLVRIAVAGWIAETVGAAGHPVIGVVPNAVDPDDMALDRPLDDRDRRVVALYHRLPSKGPDALIRTLDRIRIALPGVGADVVSARPPSHRLPDGVDLHVRPSRTELRRLYNRASVCLHTSRLEGWGLVPMEAAACGCAVVATASRGVDEFLTPGVSMRQVPVDDVDGLVRESVDLLSHPDRRIALAEAGRRQVGAFSWDASTDTFERLLHEALAPS